MCCRLGSHKLRRLPRVGLRASISVHCGCGCSAAGQLYAAGRNSMQIAHARADPHAAYVVYMWAAARCCVACCVAFCGVPSAGAACTGLASQVQKLYHRVVRAVSDLYITCITQPVTAETYCCTGTCMVSIIIYCGCTAWGMHMACQVCCACIAHGAHPGNSSWRCHLCHV